MKFSEQWLRSWVNPDITTQQMCDQLTMAGLEVDGVEPAAGDFTEVVVARVYLNTILPVSALAIRPFLKVYLISNVMLVSCAFENKY